MTESIFVYVVCKEIAEARSIAAHCVENRLASCGNILPQMESIYWWDGKINNETEVVLILKTMKAHYAELEKTVKGLHSYECPCIVTLPLAGGYKPYLDWIKTETKPEK